MLLKYLEYLKMSNTSCASIQYYALLTIMFIIGATMYGICKEHEEELINTTSIMDINCPQIAHVGFIIMIISIFFYTLAILVLIWALAFIYLSS